jgi:hypothetical protein
MEAAALNAAIGRRRLRTSLSREHFQAPACVTAHVSSEKGQIMLRSPQLLWFTMHSAATGLNAGSGALRRTAGEQLVENGGERERFATKRIGRDAGKY